MKVAVLQPNFIPWRGYFDLIDDVDLFVFYDDVQYTKHDWRNRNKIKTAEGSSWVTVPVSFSLAQPKNINEVEIDYRGPWLSKHLKTLFYSYSKAPFFERYYPEYCEILNRKTRLISQLSIDLIHWVMGALSIKTRTQRSSELTLAGSKTVRLIDLLKQVHATDYLSGPSAEDYLELNMFRESQIGLEYKQYEYPEYPQLYGPYAPDVSILDLIFNCGGGARKFLKSLKPSTRVV